MSPGFPSTYSTPSKLDYFYDQPGVSNKMNEIMKLLTVVSALFIPLTFIAGVYGMNFDRAASPWNMPELHWYWGYPACLALMGGTAIGLMTFFIRRGWFRSNL
jgi:magnesium transporter